MNVRSKSKRATSILSFGGARFLKLSMAALALTGAGCASLPPRSATADVAKLRHPSSDSELPLLLHDLSKDLAFEAEHIDSIPEDSNERERFARDWKNYLDEGAKGPSPTDTPGKSWSGLWPPRTLQTPLRETASVQIETLSLPDRGDLAAHSMSDPEKYTSNRLGPALHSFLKEKKLKSGVFGGEIEDFERTLAPGETAYRVPSLYESWGIQRYLVANGNDEMKYVFVLPPVREYVQQYAFLLKMAGAQEPSIEIDLEARARLVSSTEQSYKALLKRAGGAKPTHVFMGYSAQAEELIRSTMADRYTLKKIKSDGVLRGLWIEGLSASGEKVRILGISSEKTLWGEASEFLAQAVLKDSPKALFFMGSAGSLNPSIPIYSISIPTQFVMDGKDLGVQNFFAQTLKGRESKNPQFHVGSRHANSIGPAEQSYSYTSHLALSGVDTVDVEQNLVARAVAAHNARHPASTVLFGAANLITDRPASVLAPASKNYNLDKVDPALKQKARIEMLQLMFGSTHQVTALEPSGCPSDMRPFIGI
jgi:hypothetical protein